MATGSANCTIIGHAYGTNSLGDYNQNAAYAGFAGGSAYHGYILKFTTPDFIGASESVAFNFWLSNQMGNSATLRYALCTSDANKNSYCGTTGEVADPNQITTGTVTMDGMSTTVEQRTVNVPTNQLKPNTTYYLLLWAYNDTGVSLKGPTSGWGTFTAVLGYNSGLAHIGDGTADKLHQAYIGNGSEYKLHIPYIFDGTSWNICT